MPLHSRPLSWARDRPARRAVGTAACPATPPGPAPQVRPQLPCRTSRPPSRHLHPAPRPPTRPLRPRAHPRRRLRHLRRLRPSRGPCEAARFCSTPGTTPRRFDTSVEAGGFRKPCNTSGTTTAAGYPERAFTFNVVARPADLLRARGVTIVLTPRPTGARQAHRPRELDLARSLAVLIECGNMRNAANLTSPQWREQAATGIPDAPQAGLPKITGT